MLRRPVRVPVLHTDAVWPEGFDPERLTRDASLNRLVIGPVAGARPAHVGADGATLLGRDAVASLVRQRCGADARPDAIADRLVAALDAEAQGGPAAAVVDEVGDRLASLIATLRDPATAMAATAGRRAYLEVWQGLDTVVLGGGLMKGVVGRRVAARAAAVLAAGDTAAPAVWAAPHPQWLPLLGAARSASRPDQRVVVLDGGQTSIKRAIASFREQDLVSVRVFAPVPVASVHHSGLAALVTRAATPLLEQSSRPPSQVIFSVASYVRDGRPIENPSIYEQLDPDVLGSRLGVPVRLIHDGTAAWRGTEADASSSVIMLGTWLGVGIGPHRARLRPYAADFRVHPDGHAD